MQQTQPKSETEKRTAVYVRLSKIEYERLKREALATRMTMAALLKRRYFKNAPIKVLMSEEDAHRTLVALKRAGNNLNQIAKKLNSGFREGFNHELEEIAIEMRMIRQFVGASYGSC